MSTDPKTRFEDKTEVGSKILFPEAIQSKNYVDNSQDLPNLTQIPTGEGKPTPWTSKSKKEFKTPTGFNFSKEDKKQRIIFKRGRVIKKKKRYLNDYIKKFSEYVAEDHFLACDGEGNYLDFKSYRRNTSSSLLEYLQKHTLLSEDPDMLIRALFGRTNFPFPTNTSGKAENVKDSNTDINVKIDDVAESGSPFQSVSGTPTERSTALSQDDEESEELSRKAGWRRRPFSPRRRPSSTSQPSKRVLSDVKTPPQQPKMKTPLIIKETEVAVTTESPTPVIPVNGDCVVKRQRPSTGTKQVNPKPDGLNEDDLILLSGSTTPSKNDDAQAKVLAIGPKPPKKYSEKMKAEASVMQRIQDLQKEGMWYDKRLPKCSELTRIKAQWDYLLEEMTWLSSDFVYERKYKVMHAKKCSKMIEKYFHDREIATQRAEKEEDIRKRRQCTYLAKEIRNFWTNAQKLVEMSEKSRIELLRKKALDVHLSFIVKQTEKYSNMLAETLKTGNQAQASADDSSVDLSPQNNSEEEMSDPGGQDDDFEPLGSEEDDEETISTAEAEAAKDKSAVDKEVALLAEESEIPMDDFLDQLPEGYLDWRLGAGKDFDSVSEKSAGRSSVTSGNSAEFVETSELNANARSNDNSDTEDTDKTSKPIVLEDVPAAKKPKQDSNGEETTSSAKEEKLDDNQGKTKGDLGGEILAEEAPQDDSKDKRKVTAKETGTEVAKYRGSSPGDSDWESESDSEEYDNDSDGSETEIGTDEDEDPDQTIGLASLLQTFAPERAGEVHDDTINSVAAEAESFQPKGYTLSSTTVVTKVPFLLKHTLREYQHIGLDWLVAMYTKKLNGILADEMGLGKTIQTIALLAHLACEKGNWGPHLIVVPTSVMLNWEMEFKKWCPGFKILTYYGLQKERKLKRQGWTKPNTFHVCITSYKLVIQDHQSFRRKRWKYLILDEAQNIKNFKSQRWQLLLNFQTQRRLLLTGTPLQNNLMELWSLMHFLMPTVFQSHREFREWFSDPVSNMVEGDSSYDDNIIQRLHKVLRPFILRRLKSEVEKQLPQKYNHVILCRLSKRQRYLYEEYMERANTKETLNKGNLLSVINVLMQLRKVCNHPNLFEPRPIISPFQVVSISSTSPSLVWNLQDENKFDLPSFTLYKLTEADFKFSKEDGQRIWNRKHNFDEQIKHVDEIVQADNEEESTNIDDASILVFPPKKRSRFSEPPPIPVIDQALPWWMTNVDPTPYLEDDEFVEAVSYEARPRSPNRKHPKLVNGNKIPKFLQPSKVYSENESPFVAKSVVSFPGETKISYKDQFNIEEICSINKVNDEQSDDQKISIPKSSPKSFKKEGSNSIEFTEGEDIEYDNDTHTLTIVERKEIRICIRPREKKLDFNMSETTCNPVWLRVLGYPDPTVFSPSEVEERVLQDKRELLTRLKKINEERCKIMPLIGGDTVNACAALCDLPSMRYYGKRRRRLRLKPKPVLPQRTPSTEGYYHLGCAETYMAQQLKLCSPDSSIRNHPLLLWRMTKGLMNLTWTLEEQLQMLSEILKRFTIYVPAVSVPNPYVNYFRPKYTYYCKQIQMEQDLEHQLRRPAEILHPIVSRMSTQFPDPRLIEYDCGKLQVLNRLLRVLKTEDHRVLLFTQMAKMLDVLEAFLNYHGHIYLRLDGATKIEERQILMERFNTDKRIFCFILSTRSGGIGVNLTGADTVIFYDSDWNPTMDAQAQDRCHRIGQTRDVNIYRLVSERTIEENILRKSNQKRILGELAIEGGNFTTAYFKKDSIFDLFNVDSFENDPLQRIRNDLESSTSVMDSSGVYTRLAISKEESVPVPDDNDKTHLFESALAEAEDETDVQAARTVQAEAAAELAEFDENIPLEDPQDEEDLLPKTDVEMTIISAELTPVERYALRFMEHYIDDWSKETVSSAKKEIEHQKREWELEQLRKEVEKTRKKEKEKKENLDWRMDDMLVLNEDEEWINDMPEFKPFPYFMPPCYPPTPPVDESDVYIDRLHSFLYSDDVMDESELPSVYVPKPPKIPKKPPRPQVSSEKRETSVDTDSWKDSQAVFSGEFSSNELDDSLVNKKTPKVQRRDEPIFAPRSLFDRPSPALAKLRRDFRMQKYNPGRPVSSVPKASLGPGAITFPITPAPSQKPLPPPTSDNSPEWTVNEDFALLQAVTNFLELPLSLLVVNLAQTPNWELASELVNLTNRTHRTAKQCKYRYETIVGPREEGKLFFETPQTTPAASPTPSPTKKKKSKAFIKIGPPSPNRAARMKTTAQLMTQDNNSQMTQMFTSKYDLIKNITNRKVPTNKPMAINPHIKQSKQATIFAEHGINYDNPLPATTIAQTRYERLQLERKKLIAAQQVAAAAAASASAGGIIGTTPSPTNTNILPQSILAAMNTSPSTAIPVSLSNVQGATHIGTVAVSTGPSVGLGISGPPPGAEIVQKSRQLSNVTNLTNPPNVVPVVISQGGELVSRNTVSTHLLAPQRNQLNLSQQSVQLQHQLQILQHNQQIQAKHKQLQFSLAPQSGTSQQQTLTHQQVLKGRQQSLQIQHQHHSQQQGQTVVLSAGLAQALGTAVGSPVTVTTTPGGNVTISTAGSGSTVSSITTANARNQQILAQQQTQLQQQQQTQKSISTINMQDLVSSSPQRLTQTVTTMPATTLHSQSTPSTIVSLTPATVIGTGQQIPTKLVAGQGNVATLVSTASKAPGTVSMKATNANTMQLQFVRQGALIRQPSTVTTASQQQHHLQNQQIKRIQMVTGTGQTAIVSSSNLGSGVSVSAQSVLPSAPNTTQSTASALPVSLVQASSMMTVSTSTPLGTVATVVTPGSTRQVQLVKQHTVGGKTVTRAISESEVAAILKQHGLSNSTRLAIASTSGVAQLGSQKGQVTQVLVPVGSLGSNPTHTSHLTNPSNVVPVVISQGGELVSRNTVSTHLLAPQRNQLNLSQQSVQLQHQLQILQHNQQIQAKHKQLQFSLAPQSGTSQQQTLTHQQVLKGRQQSLQIQPRHHSQQQGQTVVLSAGLAQALGTAVGSPVTVTTTPGGNVTISTAGSGSTVSSITTANARNQQILAQQQTQLQQQQQTQKSISTINMQDLVSSSPQRLTQTVTTMPAATLHSQSTPSTIVSLTPATVIGPEQQITANLVAGQGNVATLVSTASKAPGTVSMKATNANTMQLQFVRQGALIRQPSTVTTASQQQHHLQNQQIKRIQMVTGTGQTAIVSSSNLGSGVSVSAQSVLPSAPITTQSTASALPVSLVQASPLMTVSTATPHGTAATAVTPVSSCS